MDGTSYGTYVLPCRSAIDTSEKHRGFIYTEGVFTHFEETYALSYDVYRQNSIERILDHAIRLVPALADHICAILQQSQTVPPDLERLGIDTRRFLLEGAFCRYYGVISHALPAVFQRSAELVHALHYHVVEVSSMAENAFFRPCVDLHRQYYRLLTEDALTLRAPNPENEELPILSMAAKKVPGITAFRLKLEFRECVELPGFQYYDKENGIFCLGHGWLSKTFCRTHCRTGTIERAWAMHILRLLLDNYPILLTSEYQDVYMKLFHCVTEPRK